jgi:hypothetical protein
MIFEGQNASEKRIYLLYDEVTRQNHVIANLTGAMAKRYVCEGCGKSQTHKSNKSCTDCMSTPSCALSEVRIPCASCNRTFISQACFDRHRTNKMKGKTVCEKKRNCSNCGTTLTSKKHECYKFYCKNCMNNEQIVHLCYMRPLVNELTRSDNVRFVFYDFETTQNTRYSDSATEHVPFLVCVQQFCKVCETLDYTDDNSERCGKRKRLLRGPRGRPANTCVNHEGCATGSSP